MMVGPGVTWKDGGFWGDMDPGVTWNMVGPGVTWKDGGSWGEMMVGPS